MIPDCLGLRRFLCALAIGALATGVFTFGLANPASARMGEEISRPEASRFLSQASLGASHKEVRKLARDGYERWIKRQLSRRPTYLRPYFERLYDRLEEEYGEDDLDPILIRQAAWWRGAVWGKDALRQRVALALSEIFVVSDRMDELEDRPEALVGYYDILLKHALGNYRDLLRAVTLSPAMGFYLSHLNNERGDPSLNRFPDENYAREVMQLFSIGLHELNQDGSLRTGADGLPIPAYGNREVREFARIFTGLGLDGYLEEDDEWAYFGGDVGDYYLPMRMYEEFHEQGEKRLLRGLVVPAGQEGMDDIEMALENLFRHPNVGPFIGRQLIQRLVTSNPAPAYVARVAAVFADDGKGERGNLGAVVRAILLDPEARDLNRLNDPTFGRLREPLLRVVRLIRTFRPRRMLIDSESIAELTGQEVLNAPSVFNFFSPGFAPRGPIRDAGLVAPEFQITTSSTGIAYANLAMWLAADGGLHDAASERFRPFNLRRERRLAEHRPEALLDRLDLLLTHCSMTAGTRDAIRRAMDVDDDPEYRVAMALYLILISPDWNVVR